MTKYCDCGYFKPECECCGEGKICPVCGGEKWTSHSQSSQEGTTMNTSEWHCYPTKWAIMPNFERMQFLMSKGLTDAEIAERLYCHRVTIGRWKKECREGLFQFEKEVFSLKSHEVKHER